MSERKGGERERRRETEKEAQKWVGPKLTGPTLLTHRRGPLFIFLSYIYVCVCAGELCSGYTDFGAPTVVCFIAMATLSC